MSTTLLRSPPPEHPANTGGLGRDARLSGSSSGSPAKPRNVPTAPDGPRPARDVYSNGEKETQRRRAADVSSGDGRRGRVGCGQAARLARRILCGRIGRRPRQPRAVAARSRWRRRRRGHPRGRRPRHRARTVDPGVRRNMGGTRGRHRRSAHGRSAGRPECAARQSALSSAPRVARCRRSSGGTTEGFSNEGLWPLCHRAHVQPVFRSDDFSTYAAVNARFAAAVCEEAGAGRPLVLVQDYHFALAPRMLRQHLPSSTIVAFWHIPWPHPDDFAICPWGRQLLEGLLGSSIVGFQTPADCRNFLDAAVRSRVRTSTGPATSSPMPAVGRRCAPIRCRSNGTARASAARRASMPVAHAVRRQLGLAADVSLGVGVDRLDYTKGISEKFLAIERMLETRPELRGHFVFAQIAEPSRAGLPAYQRTAHAWWRRPNASTAGSATADTPRLCCSRRATSRPRSPASSARRTSATSAACTTA